MILALKIERFQIMGKAHQVSLWRQFVLRMPPITVAENPQLTAVDNFLQAVLYVKEASPGRTSARLKGFVPTVNVARGSAFRAFRTSIQSIPASW